MDNLNISSVGGGGGAPGPQGPEGRPGLTILPDEPETPEDPIIVIGPSGPAGAAGSAGTNGAPGRAGDVFLPDTPDDPDEPMIIPGPQGVAGVAGSTGPQGAPGVTTILMVPFEEPEQPEEPMLIQGPRGATGAPGGGGGSATTIEQNLGSTPTWRGKFTLTDAAITSTSKVLIWQAPGPYTGKGTRADEAEMARITAIAEPGSGSAIIRWETQPITAACVIRASDGGGSIFNAVPIVHTNKRLNKVEGNVKFTYMVFS